MVEARRAQRHVRDRDAVVGDDDRAGAEHRARFGHRLEAVGEVHALRGGEHRGGGAAGVEGLDLVAGLGAAGEAVDQLAGRDPELDLVVAGTADAAGDRDDLGPGRLLGAEALEPVGALGDDPRHVGERLDVVDQRRPAVEALDRREGRLQPRVAALALERVQQRRLLAADVGAGAAVDDQLEVAVGAEDVRPQVARLVRFGDRGVEDVGLVVVLAADEDEGVAGVGGEGGDRDPLDQLVRVALHQLAVLEGAGLGLVGVAAEVLGHLPARQEGGLFAHREAGAAAAAQAGVFELLEDLVLLHLAVGLLQRRVAADQPPVAVEGPQRRILGALQQHPRLPPVSHPEPPGRRADFRRFSARRRRGVAGEGALGLVLGGEDLGAGLELLDREAGLGGVERAVVALVDRGHRRDVAGAEALEAGDEEVLVALGGGLEGVEQLVAAAHPAADVGADLDPVAADRVGVQEVVEAGDRLQVGGRHPHHRGGLADPLRSAPAVALLHRPERRDRGRFTVRVARHQLLDPLPQLGRAVDFVQLRDRLRVALERPALGQGDVDRQVRVDRAAAVDGAHRSTPPRIGSSIPRLQIMSAM